MVNNVDDWIPNYTKNPYEGWFNADGKSKCDKCHGMGGYSCRKCVHYGEFPGGRRPLFI